MKGFIAILSLATLGLSPAAMAQTAPKQTPPAASTQRTPGPLGKTGLKQDQAAGIAAGIILLGIGLSDDNDSSTTTATK